MSNVSCYSDFSFVQVIRVKGKYNYMYYLGCGEKKYDGGSRPSLLGSSDLAFSFSEGKNITNLTRTQKTEICKNNFTIS